MDIVAATRTCCYPTPPFLERESNIPLAMIADLRKEIRRSKSCHVVSAAAPDKQGEQLRIGTTFLEAIIMVNLTQMQYQYFLTLKFLHKRVISSVARGLKTYHFKTLLFESLDSYPPEKWQTQNFRQMLLEALEKLMKLLREVQTSTRMLMTHFFLPDAALYLRGSCNAQKIADAVQDTIDNLDEKLCQFISELKPLTDETICFNPFLNMTLLKCQLTNSASLEPARSFYAAMTAVIKCLEHLSTVSISPTTDMDSVLHGLDERIGDWALAAKVSLRALTLVKFGQTDQARRELLDAIESDGFWNQSGRLTLQDCESTDAVWRRMRQTNFAAKFCCRLDDDYQLRAGDRLPGFRIDVFPHQLANHISAFYINFTALVIYLAVMLAPDRVDDQSVMRLATAEDADFQEIFLALSFGRDSQQLVDLVHMHRETISNESMLLQVLIERFSRETSFEEASIDKALIDLAAS